MNTVANINFNGESLDIEDTHAREQLRHLTTDSYVADVTGDYNVNADNVTMHAKGDYNVNAADIEMTSVNSTQHTTGNRTVDTDGNYSVHIDGTSTLNVGGLRTETFAGDKTETVTGTLTKKLNNASVTASGSVNATASGSVNATARKLTVSSDDITINTKNPIKITSPIAAGERYDKFTIIDSTGTERYGMMVNANTEFTLRNTPYNADENTLNAILQNCDGLVLFGGKYELSKTLVIPNGKTLSGNGATFSVTGKLDYAVSVGDVFQETSGNTGTRTELTGVTIQCHYKSSGVLIKVSSADVHNIRITGATVSGIDVYNETLVESRIFPSDAYISDVQIYWENFVHTFTQYGIRVYGTDNDLRNIRTLSTVVGIYQAPGAICLFCANCHPLGADGFNDVWNDTVGFYLNAGYVTLTDCYSDKFRIGIKICGNSMRITTNAFRYNCDYVENKLPRYVVTYQNPSELAFNNTSSLSGPVPYLYKEQAGLFFGALQYMHFDHFNTGVEPVNFNLRDDSYYCVVAGRNTYDIHSTRTETLVAVLSSYAGGTPCLIKINGESYYFNDLIIQCNPEQIINEGACYPSTLKNMKIRIYRDGNQSLYIFVVKPQIKREWINVTATGSNAVLIPRESEDVILPQLTLVREIGYNV